MNKVLYIPACGGTMRRESLLDIPSGRKVRVAALTGDGASRSRLCALGLTPGTSVEICPGCARRGSRRVRVRNSSLVLGESLACCVQCECNGCDDARDDG